ncbi:hypothetical protein PIB30_040566 [Stylosanthes scabra]|uniref:Uncharacterized protein n=1 Tax=Stylosanthes scabra TaxID=79078 RepID=A0ABU6XCB5_9FABA|nr:hypothetical protein [Stylosanthes scabra]
MAALFSKKRKGKAVAESSNEAPRFKTPFHEAYFKGKLSARKIHHATTNRSELTVERAVLIHSIIIGENINVEEITAEQFYKFIYKTDLSSSLPFPSIIAALCLDAKVVPHKDDTMIPQEIPIAGEAMIYRRLDQQQEENRKSFEAINTRMDRMDDQLSFLCYSNQMSNETMYYPY